VPILFGVAAIARVRAQNAAPQAAAVSLDDPKFAAFVYDVVSFKPHKDDPRATSRWMGSREELDGLTIHQDSTIGLVGMAFGTTDSRISGAPDWSSKDSWDVQAKMEPEVADALSKLSPAEQKLARRHMMQELVRDYLKVQFHMTQEEVPAFDLIIAKNGPKLNEVTDPNVPDHGFSLQDGPNGTSVLVVRATTLSELQFQFELLASTPVLDKMGFWFARPVVDKTGLTGRYDFKVIYLSEPLAEAAVAGSNTQPDAAPPFATALEEQTGLKLVPSKGMLDVIVIDHIEQPSQN
jgi:bla regulator protein blaR1